MENNQYIAAVDLGTTKVVVAVGKKVDKNRVEIIAFKETHSDGVIKGDVRNLELAHQTVKEAKEAIENELGIVIHEVVVSISGKHIQSNSMVGYVVVQNSDNGFSEVKQRDVERLNEEMKKSSSGNGKTIIDVIPQVYRVDEEVDISEPVGMEGKRLEAKFNVVEADENAVKRLGRCFERAGLTMLNPMLQAVASAEAVLSEDEKELGVAVVDIGGGTTDVCIYYDKIIRHIAVIPIGGNSINNDIKNFAILNKHVEKLKTKFGEAIAAKAPAESYIKIQGVNGQAPKQIAIKALAGIIEARMFDIIEYVKNEMDKVAFAGKLGAGIVLTGGGATLKNLDLLFKQKLECDVRVACPVSGLTKESAEKVANPKYSTICGVMVLAASKGIQTKVEVLDRVHQDSTEEMVGLDEMATGVGAIGTATMASGYATEQSYSENPEDSYQSHYQESQFVNQDEKYYDEQTADDEYDVEEVKPEKKGIFGKLKKWIGNAMTEGEQIDDEDNY